jgi:DNA-3-methyladenine glycosylase I
VNDLVDLGGHPNDGSRPPVRLADWPRCWWANVDPLLIADHDEAWGRPVTDDITLFEMLTLEAFQAGLSWLTILRKRDAFRAAFGGFDPGVIAQFDDADRDRLMADAGIVRNRAKIDASIGNARAFLDVVAEFGSFHKYVERFVGTPPPTLPPTAQAGDIPATTPASDALSRDLKQRGFKFVGSTIVYAFLQAAGFVDDHMPGCWRYRGGDGA